MEQKSNTIGRILADASMKGNGAPTPSSNDLKDLGFPPEATLRVIKILPAKLGTAKESTSIGALMVWSPPGPDPPPWSLPNAGDRRSAGEGVPPLTLQESPVHRLHAGICCARFR
jgi:hypothetical protein